MSTPDFHFPAFPARTSAPGSIKQAQLVVLHQTPETLGMVLLEEGRLELLLRDQRPALVVGCNSKAAALDDREVRAEEVALLMGRQGNDLEAELLGYEEDRAQDMVTRRLAEGVIGHDDARVVLGLPDMAALFRER